MTTVETNGLKDMIACNTRISSIIDDHLSYAGYDISEFMDNKASFEETYISCGMGIYQPKWNLNILKRNCVRIMIFRMPLSNVFSYNQGLICIP